MKIKTLAILTLAVSGSFSAYAETFSGAIALTNRMRPELSAGGQTYYLHVPRRALVGAGLKDGSQLTVEGDVESYTRQGQTSQFIRVSKISAAGKEIALPQGRHGSMKQKRGSAPSEDCTPPDPGAGPMEGREGH